MCLLRVTSANVTFSGLARVVEQEMRNYLRLYASIVTFNDMAFLYEMYAGKYSRRQE